MFEISCRLDEVAKLDAYVWRGMEW